jgi:hypothetical protein
MNCQGAIVPQRNDCSMPHSDVWNLASKSCLASPDDCQAGNRKGEIVSQRVMGLLDADCATKCVETSLHGTGKTRLLASQGRGLLAAFGVTTSLRPSVHRVPLSTSGDTAGVSPVSGSQRYPKSPYKEKYFGTKKMMFEISPQADFCNHDLPVTSASSDGATIHTSHNNEDACDCTPIRQETSAVSLPRDSPFNDANNSRSCITTAQCVEKQDVTCSNIHDTGDDNFLAASSNFFRRFAT